MKAAIRSGDNSFATVSNSYYRLLQAKVSFTSVSTVALASLL